MLSMKICIHFTSSSFSVHFIFRKFSQHTFRCIILGAQCPVHVLRVKYFSIFTNRSPAAIRLTRHASQCEFTRSQPNECRDEMPLTKSKQVSIEMRALCVESPNHKSQLANANLFGFPSIYVLRFARINLHCDDSIYNRQFDCKAAGSPE